MKLHINTENKTVALEGTARVSDVFNHLMQWFPENWEKWSFVPHTETYKEIIVQKEVYKNPYWNPWSPLIYEVGDNPSPVPNIMYTSSSTATINLI
jgi:competence CoiA-like predicted nuclease